MKLYALALWHARQEKTQLARATLKEAGGDLGAASQATANARMHRMAADAIADITDEALRLQSADLAELQFEFRTWLFDCVGGRAVRGCALNGAPYEGLNHMLNYSRAMAIAHPGVQDIVVSLRFAEGTEVHSIGKEFLVKRAHILI